MKGGRADADLANKTGGRVRISQSSAQDGTAITVTITAYGAEPPNRWGKRSKLNSPSYFEVTIVGISDGSASVSLTNNSGKPPTTMQYMKNGDWVSVTGVSTSGNTITGGIPVIDLHSPIVIGT